MGRPLKIAKAQAVLTITNTATAGSVITVSGGNLITSPTVGIMSGMSFICASSISGLVANTVYYVDTILSNNTLSVSQTQLSVQPRVMASLANSSGGTVKASFAVVDAYFNNPVGGAGFPATNANTYGVVGGNTAIVGKQVLANVAFGVNGTGTIYASTGSALVFGDANTNFDTNFVAGTAIQAGTANINGISTNYATVGFVSSTGNTDVTVANTVVSGNIIGVSSADATDLSVNNPVQFVANIGSLVAGTTYFVKAIANADAFTVSTTIGGPEVQMTANTSATTARQQVTYLVGAASLVNATGSSYIYSTAEAGYIVRQKGKTKYLVTGTVSGLTGACYTANVANTALTPNTMSIIATNAAPGTQYVSSVNDYNSEVFPATVAPGSLVTGTVYTIYSAGTTNWTSVGAMANMTGITFAATGTGSGTGLAVLSTVNPDIIGTFNTAYVANAANGQPNPIVTIAGV
jgi:hypothetical protein